jgi:hypothetical protein
VPKPPRWASTGLLIAFFVAAVPLDGWLTRRSLRRGARSRFGALRYPAIVLLTVAGAFIITEAATGRDMSVIRCDVIDIGPEPGALHGQATAFVARGRAGRMTIATPGSELTLGQRIRSWEEMPFPAKLLVAADASPRVEGAVLDVNAWEIVRVLAAWIPASAPEGLAAPTRLGELPQVPACIGACVRSARDVENPGYVMGEIPAGPFDARSSYGGLDKEAAQVSLLLSQATNSPMPDGEPCDFAVILRGAHGAEIRIDGAPLRAPMSYTILRMRYPESARPPLSEEPE